MSNLTRTLAVLSLLAPVGAYPLGVGDIKLHSALNQNLDADIALMLSPGERISDVKVSLAPPDKFDERGVPWSYFLSNISFTPTVRSDGSAVIKVKSRAALKEPVLDLLLQVTWPKGTSYRHFSLLIDPPAAYAQPTVPTLEAPEIGAEPTLTPIARSEAPSPSPSASSPVAEPTPIARVRRPRPHKDAIVKGVYGPTRRNDTLWSIAEKASKPYHVSVEQMMVAIYRNNPEAFYKDNMNALQAKVKVKIPDRDMVVKLSRSEALAELNRQNDAWRHGAQAVAEAPEADHAESDVTADNQLRLTAPVEANVGENAVIPPGQEKNTGQAAKGEPGAAANAQAMADMQAKMAEMEERLVKLQTLLTLKEKQLAAIQDQSAQMPAAQPSVSANPPEISAQPQAESAAEQPAAADQQKPPVAASPEKPPIPQKATPKPVQTPAVVDEPLPWALIGGAGAAVLSVLGFFWWRRRKASEEESLATESMFSPSIIYKAPETDSSFSMPVLDTGSAYEVSSVAESSFLSEFTPSDFDAFDNDQNEIDPISEADVYLAYGRYQQAEELMRSAIENYPDRNECKLKLLEIFYASENKAGFDAYVKELALAGKDQDSVFWEKVVEMGQELSPHSPLLFSAQPAKRAEKASPSVSLDKLQDEAFTKDEFDTAFDFIELDDDGIADSASGSEAQDDVQTDDFDLSAFGLSDELGAAGNETSEIDEERNNQSVDFDLDGFSLEHFGSEAIKAESNKDSGHEVDFDLGSLDFSSDLSDLDAQPKISEDDFSDLAIDQFEVSEESRDADTSGKKSDFDFDFDLSALTGAADSEAFDAADVSDLTDMDELETKLDLAKAYRDMGDNESAKDIVSEVLEKGNVEQKKLAQELLSELM